MKNCLCSALLALAASGAAAAATAAPAAAAPAPAAEAAARVVRTSANYSLPAVPLLRADGAPVTLAAELDHPGAVALNFVFTSCSAVCPIQSRTFAELQARAAPGLRLRLMSISLDPLSDTPAVLREYGRKFGAGREWRFYTGTPDASVAAQRAFDVYRGNKMNHEPLVLLRSRPGQPWVRVEGYADSSSLLRTLEAGAAAGPVKIRSTP
jgi:protein SCO1/2